MSEKKKQLLNVAEQLFYDYGFHGVGLKQIIQEANVATMTLYNHFASKDRLVAESIRNREEKYWAYMSPVDQYHTQPFITLAEKHGLFLKEVSPQGCMFLRAIEVYSETNPDIAQIARDHKSKLLRFFEELGASVGIEEYKDFSYQFLLILEGATSMTQITDSEQATAHAITMTKRLLQTYE